MPTVDVQPLPNYPALKMTWQQQVAPADVVAAFQAITTALNASDQPMFVIVDLLSNPQFPLVTTIHEALTPYRHPHLQEWLVVGSNWMAQAVEGALSKITKQKNVRWFSSEADAVDYLQTAIQIPANH